MRLPLLKSKGDTAKTTTSDATSQDAMITPAPVPDSVQSLGIRIHNRTVKDLLAVSSVGALVSQSTYTSSSINPNTRIKDTKTGNVFSVRKTPVLVAAKSYADLPPIDIAASTAASSKGYVVDLSILAKGAPVGTGLSASVAAPAPVSTATTPASNASSASDNKTPLARRWKKLDLSAASQAGEKTSTLTLDSVYALQSIPTSPTDVVHILLLTARPTSDWMSTLPDTDPLSSLCIPATHESCALYGWPISTCQESSASVAAQLARGIRYLDVRLSLKADPATTPNQLLYAYHGVSDQKIEFGVILQQVYDFLAKNPREAVFVSVKQENAIQGFRDVVLDTYVAPNRGKWYLGVNVPKLGEVRGKIVLVSRFGKSNEQPGGIHPLIWPDSSSSIFSYQLPSSQTVLTQDWYNISSLSSIPAKLALVAQLFQQAGHLPDVLALNFTNASSFPFALPPFAAKGLGDQTREPDAAAKKSCFQVLGINALLVDLLADRLKLDTKAANLQRAGLMNVVGLDFYDQDGLGADLAGLLIDANFV
ncbi:PLC-like phosphodiesterase [Testicularia cyperi]|uniref:PLC-like phosphodiesterase n=1 Tax=Testicularia cyperi TaxID=1882483 RepID=A0A317XKR7_9BASI|nr:PLC-like phosphodiesterase [Testicularia cyperi]